MFQVLVNRKVLRSLRRLPDPVQRKLANLVEDLRDRGPVRGEWPNFSRLGPDTYHCHLSPRWAVCWRCESGTSTIEVTYAGSRENAPY